MNKNDDDIEMPTDIELALAEYLGTPEGASFAFEVGERNATLIWVAGYKAATNHFYSASMNILQKELDSLSLK